VLIDGREEADDSELIDGREEADDSELIDGREEADDSERALPDDTLPTLG
jgi:hypothetical protein